VFEPAEEVPAADAFASQIDTAVQLAKQKLEQARQRAKRIVDPARRDKQYAAGDMVLLSSKNNTQDPWLQQAAAEFIGPFKVLDVL
jgi:hypothetical protein